MFFAPLFLLSFASFALVTRLFGTRWFDLVSTWRPWRRLNKYNGCCGLQAREASCSTVDAELIGGEDGGVAEERETRRSDRVQETMESGSSGYIGQLQHRNAARVVYGMVFRQFL